MILNKINIYPYNKQTIKKEFFVSNHTNKTKDYNNILKNNSFESLWDIKGINFRGNLSTLSKNIKESIIYHTELAKALGVKSDCLKSILAPDELINILKKEAKLENFSLGENFENILNGNFRINLHIHTKNSDGNLSVDQILNQAVKYAEYRKSINKSDPVIIAITDHDGINGTKEAVSIIAKNPEKYKDIKLVLGIEFNTQYNSRQLETIGYCINPFNEKLNHFLESRRNINKEYLNSFIKERVNKWEANADIKPDNRTTMEKVLIQTQKRNIDCASHLKYFGSPGLMLGFTNTLKSIFYERGWKFDGIDKFSYEHGMKYKSFGINPATPHIKEIIQIIKESDAGFIGVAHPCRNLSNVDLNVLFQDFKKFGINAVETNYQYPENKMYSKSFREYADLAAVKAEMIKTGGQDNHTDNIFTNKFNIKDFPSIIKSIVLDK